MIRHYINGQLVEGQGAFDDIVDPSSGAVAARYRTASEAQAHEALVAARDAFVAWSGRPVADRVRWIGKLSDAIRERRDDILDTLVLETGKPRPDAEYDFGMLIRSLDFFAEAAAGRHDALIPAGDGNYVHMVVREPLGVVAGYLAWNFPLLNLGYKLGPALASGCTCVIKPSEYTPASTLQIGQIAESIGFPAGVFNLAAGDGSMIGSVWNGSEIPALLTVIGSTRTGLEVIRQSATSIKSFSLELGGNAPALVMEGADLACALDTLVSLKFTNAGQVCVSPNRILVHDSLYEAFVSGAAARIREIRLGSGAEQGAQMGPMIRQLARARVAGMVEEAVGQGAELVAGGAVPVERREGFYYSPTLLANVRPSMRIYREEVFGPVMSVMRYTDEAEAVRMANDTAFGLAAYVFSRDLDTVLRVSGQLRAGTVNVNGAVYEIDLPHGGIKNSGTGKDCSMYSLEDYTYLKRVSIARRPPT